MSNSPTSDTRPATTATAAPRLQWSPFSAVMVAVAIYLASAVIGDQLVSAYPSLRHFSALHTKSWLATTQAQFWYVFVVEALTLLGLWLFLRWRKGSFRSLGLVRPRLRDPLLAVLALGVYMVLYLVILSVLTQLIPSLNVNQAQQLGFSAQQDHTGLILTFISLVILPPLVEEITLRGFLFTSLLQKLKFPIAALITSLIFAAAHLEFGNGGPLVWVAAVDTFVLSMVLCFVRYRTGSLWPGITVHALKNLIAFMSLFVLHIS